MTDASVLTGTGTRFSRTRGRLLGGTGQGMMYPTPFFDLASTWMPQGFKSMFEWLRYYFLNNGFFNVVVSKLAEYPITNVIFEAEGEKAAKKWTDYFHHTLRYRLFQLEVGLDYFVYGNAFVSVRHRFIKHLTCTSCGHTATAHSMRKHWSFQNYNFQLTCPRCGFHGPAKARDRQVPSASGVRLVRWNPEDITIKCLPVSGTKTFHYNIPATIRNDIIIGRPGVVEDIPQAFIEAVQKNMSVILPAEEVFHMARPTVSGFDKGWGIPLLMPVLKDGFQMQILKKAHESILLEHMIPLRILFPQPAAGTADPFTSVPLTLWKEHISQELARFRWDPGYIPIMPLPVGQQSLGGDGKALLLDQQIQAQAEWIVVQLGVPKEIIFGGASWSGTNVSMRSVENFFLGYLTEHESLLAFVINKISTVLDWPKATARFAPFRMAEDLQRKQLLLQLKQMGAPLSWNSLLGELNLNAKDEAEQSIQENELIARMQRALQKSQVQLQNEMGVLQAKGQVEAQQQAQAAQAGPVPGEPGAQQAAPPEAAAPEQFNPLGGVGAPTGADLFGAAVSSKLNGGQSLEAGGVPLTQVAEMILQMLGSMMPKAQKALLDQIKASSPDLYGVIAQMMSQQQAAAPATPPPAQAAPAAPQVDMRPLPEQRPPRRAQLI